MGSSLDTDLARPVGFSPFPDDTVTYSRRLDEDAARLFTHSIRDLEVRHVIKNANENNCTYDSGVISNARDLERAITPTSRGVSTKILIIRSPNSWGRFRIPYQDFRRILSSFQVFPCFLDFVHGFGTKVDDRDENFGGYGRRLYNKVEHGRVGYEFCYNVRYAERHGRNSEYPWVLRHAAVYQRCDLESSTSDWILLQPPPPIEGRLEGILRSFNSAGIALQRDCPIIINLAMLSTTELNWRAYINHLEEEIGVLNEKACFSRVGRACNFDYSLAFSDSQELQQSRERLFKALSAIESSLETVRGLEEHCKDLEKLGFFSLKSTTHTELEQSQSRLRAHKRAIQRLLNVSQGTFTLLMKIIDHRHDEMVQKSATRVQGMLHSLGRENEALTTIAQKTQSDSRSMKIITAIGMIYLPANLVAAVYSTSIVHAALNTGSQDSNSGRMPYASSYALITIILMALTIIIAVLWEKSLLPWIFKTMRSILRRL